MTPLAPPDHVLNTFGLTAHPPIEIGDSWHGGWRVGEVVLYCSGSSARQTQVTQNRPVDATIMAIVDQVTVGDDRRYVKA